jgi:hypothetical protein
MPVSYPLLMTSDNLSLVLQTALSDTVGGAKGVTFKLQEGLDPPKAIGVISSSPSQGRPSPVFSGEVVGPDLSILPVREHHIWVLAHAVFSKLPLPWQAKTSELMAIWDYDGKLESWGWSQEHSLRILNSLSAKSVLAGEKLVTTYSIST